MNERQRRAAARAVLHKAWRFFGRNAFGVEKRGPNWEPLRDAERYGWVSFIADRCRIEPAGVEELAPWRGGEAAD